MRGVCVPSAVPSNPEVFSLPVTSFSALRTSPSPSTRTSKLGRSRMRSQRGRTGRVRTKGDMPWEYSRLCLFMFTMCSLITFPGAPPRTLK